MPNRRFADGATGSELLGHPFRYLIRQILRVKLRNRAHTPVHQQSAWGLVDVLAGRDQADAVFIELGVYRHVVGAVTSQPVNLVHDDVVDVAFLFLEVAQHRFKRWPVGGSARDTALDKLFRDNRTEALGLLLVGLALGRDGEALRSASFGGLLAG